VTQGGRLRKKKKTGRQEIEGARVRIIEVLLQIILLPELHRLFTESQCAASNTGQWTYFDDVTCKQVRAIFGRRGYAA
jgi:hypothetical protein